MGGPEMGGVWGGGSTVFDAGRKTLRGKKGLVS